MLSYFSSPYVLILIICILGSGWILFNGPWR
jgi:hypothetical protein